MKLSLSKSLRQKARFSFLFSITLLFVPLELALASGSPPSVDAGPARVLAFPAKELTLLGHATDPENDPLAVIWTMINGPAPVKFSAPWALATTVSFTTTGTYTFQLAVSDSTSNVTSNVTVTVNPASLKDLHESSFLVLSN